MEKEFNLSEKIERGEIKYPNSNMIEEGDLIDCIPVYYVIEFIKRLKEKILDGKDPNGYFSLTSEDIIEIIDKLSGQGLVSGGEDEEKENKI